MKIVSEQSAFAAVENGIGKDTFVLYVLHERSAKAWELYRHVTFEELQTLSDIFPSLPIYTVRKDEKGAWLYSYFKKSEKSAHFERYETFQKALKKIGSRL